MTPVDFPDEALQMQRALGEVPPFCPGCGKRIGVYEPIWRIAPDIGAEETSWLNLTASGTGIESLWHATCAEQEGVPGG